MTLKIDKDPKYYTTKDPKTGKLMFDGYPLSKENNPSLANALRMKRGHYQYNDTIYKTEDARELYYKMRNAPVFSSTQIENPLSKLIEKEEPIYRLPIKQIDLSPKEEEVAIVESPTEEPVIEEVQTEDVVTDSDINTEIPETNNDQAKSKQQQYVPDFSTLDRYKKGLLSNTIFSGLTELGAVAVNALLTKQFLELNLHLFILQQKKLLIKIQG